MALLALLGSTASFAHIIYGINDTVGPFGYKYMSSFLYSSGHVVTLICASLFMLYMSGKSTSEYQRTFKMASYMFLYVGCYFAINIVIPKKQLFGGPDYPPIYYYASMLVLSICSGVLLSLLQSAIMRFENKLREIIAMLFKGYYEDLEELDLINPWKKTQFKSYRTNLTENVAEHEQR